jgi:NADPH2:quinone reductase
MKAAVYSQNGGPEGFSYEEVNDPRPQANEVLIKVEAISIEGGDLSNRQLSPPKTPKHIVGYAAAGEIIELGTDVTGFKVGQKVITFSWAGSHAELRAVSASTTFAIPDGMDLQLAVASFIGVGTAALAIHLSAVQPGDTVLVTGATGGVGNAVVQLLANAGIKVFAAGRHADTLKALKEFGIAESILVGDAPIHEQVKTVKPEGVDIVIDTVGMDVLIDGIKSLKDGGKVVLIAGRAGAANFIDPLYILSHRITVIGCLLGVIMHEPFVRDLLKSSLKQVAEEEVKVPIHQVFRLSEVKEAHAAAEQVGKLGRIIMVP